MISLLDDYMSSLSSELDEKQEFYGNIELFLYEAWGGCPKALYNLGNYIWHDYRYQEMADCFISESAKKGYAPAMYSHGDKLLVKAKNHSELAAAIRLLKKAGKAGSSDAYKLLGDVFKAGKGVKKNAKRAKKYYSLAGNDNSASNVAA